MCERERERNTIWVCMDLLEWGEEIMNYFDEFFLYFFFEHFTVKYSEYFIFKYYAFFL